MNKIVEIWESGEGVLSLHIFNGIAGGEAYNREAAMIECIGRHVYSCVSMATYNYLF